MSCSQPQSSFAKMAPRSKVVHGKNKSPSGVWLRQRHVPVPQIRLSPDSDQLLGSSSDDGDDDDDDDDDDTNTHTSRRHFHSKRGGCECSSSFDGSTVGDATFGGNNKGDGHSGDEYDDGNDDTDNDSHGSFSSSASSGDFSSSASNPIQPSSNRNAFGRRDNADVMLLSRTNNSLQQRISSSDSSSLIGPRQNPDRNARAKAHSYEVGDDSSDFGTDCTSSDESAIVDAGDSSFPIPNSFKPSPRLSFELSNVPCSKGRAMIGPVVNLHLGSPERGDVSRRGRHSQTHWDPIFHNGCESTQTVTTCKRCK